MLRVPLNHSFYSTYATGWPEKSKAAKAPGCSVSKLMNHSGIFSLVSEAADDPLTSYKTIFHSFIF